MKTIIATIKPIHLNNIRRGVKTIEARKNYPSIVTPFKVLCCESGSGGKIKAEFICRKIVPLIPTEYQLKELCIDIRDFNNYMGKKLTIYGWHISDMIDYCSTKGYKIRNVSEFGLKRAPQSWQYVDDID